MDSSPRWFWDQVRPARRGWPLSFLAYAHNGIEAVQLAKEHRPEPIIMDIGMPELNGYEACRQIRSLENGKYVRIIALSGLGQPKDMARSRAAGFDAHLVKPISPEDLRRVVAELDQACEVRS